jgi:PhnB protein
MLSINPYLNFAGNTEDAFKFYKSVFGGDFSAVMRFKDSPDTASRIPEKEKNMLMHIALPVGKWNALMATDAVASMGHTFVVGDNIQLALEAETKEEAQKVFQGLSSGGTVKLPMRDMSWGAYFGMLKDKFGIHWMVSYTPKK